MGDVAQRPQALVGEAEVVALLLLLRQPDAADAVGRVLGRHHHVVVLVDGVAVGGARAVRDPGARAGAHHRLERGDQAARRALDLDHVVLAPRVDVGLAVGDDQHLVALQVLAQDAAQRVRAPSSSGSRRARGARPRGRAPAPAGRARSAAVRARSSDALSAAADRRAQQRLALTAAPCMPATQPRQLISAITTVISATTAAMRGEQVQHVLARVGAAPLREAHVVHDHQRRRAARCRRAIGLRRDVQRAVGELQHPVARLRRRSPARSAPPAGSRRWRRRACRRGRRSRARRSARPAGCGRSSAARAACAPRGSRISSTSGSCAVFAISAPRASRSRTNHWKVRRSTSGTTA